MLAWNEVINWVRGGAGESDTLDFKAAFWPSKTQKYSSEEIAKDVASLANHRGGTIVVGVADRNDRACGFSSSPLPGRPDQAVLQSLEKHLVPTSATAAVNTYVLSGDYEGEAKSVLIVDVRGWPNGPVAVRREGGLYQLPVRRGTHTVELAWEDAMRDLTSAHRRNWLRFQDWRANHQQLPVHIGTAVGAVKVSGEHLPVDIPLGGHFAELAAVDEDVVTLNVVRTSYVKYVLAMASIKLAEAAKQDDAGSLLVSIFGSLAAQDAWNTVTRVQVPVPYELISAAWLERVERGARLHLLLGAELVFAGERWYLRPVR